MRGGGKFSGGSGIACGLYDLYAPLALKLHSDSWRTVMILSPFSPSPSPFSPSPPPLGLTINAMIPRRYVYATVWGRSDYSWQGTSSWVPHGFSSPSFVDFIGGLTPSLRTLFHFPPVGHRFYSPASLRALEDRYPGWDRTGDYSQAAAALLTEGWPSSKL